MVVAAACTGGLARADSPFVHGRDWEWRITIGNDVFTEVTPPIDDSGFTTDLGFTLRRWLDPYVAGIALRHRTITEVGGRRRWDLLDVFASVEQALHPYVTAGARLGPSFSGNLGGRAIQNGWHVWTGTGPTLDEGLQDRYEGGREVGGVAGGFARATIGEPDAHAFGMIDAQGALGGTGVTFVEVLAGGRASTPVGGVQLGASLVLGAGWYHVADDNLALRGGYGTGASPIVWRAGVHVAWHRFRFEYTYRANEGGSGEPIGTIELIAAR